MANIFGNTEVLPAWLRNDGTAARQASRDMLDFNQKQIENRRAERRLTMEEDQEEVRKTLLQSQVEGQRLKVDEAKAYASDTPFILEAGQAFQHAKTQEEVDQIANSILPKLKSFQGQEAFNRVRSIWEGQISRRKLENFGAKFDMAIQDFTLANGRPPTEDERRNLSSETFMRVDPETWAKSVLPRQITADASMENAAGRAISTGLGGAAGVRAAEGVENMVKGLTSIGQSVDEAEIANVKSKALLGGMSAVNAPASVVKDIESENKAFQQLEKATSKIAAFDAKYGAGAFNEYVGPVDAPVFKWKTKVLPPEKLSAADREAKDIFRDANYIIQAYRKNNFGTALTANETAAFKEIIGDPSFADYSNGLSTFKDSVKRGAEISVRDHRFSPNIPLEIKKRFLTPDVPVSASTPSFNTMAEAEAAKLPPGTIVIIGGKRYRSK